MNKLLKLTPKQTIQALLDSMLGTGKALATDNSRVLFISEESKHGSNEIEVGTWSFGAKGAKIYLSIGWEEAIEHIKNNTKPDRKVLSFNMAPVEFNSIDYKTYESS